MKSIHLSAMCAIMTSALACSGSAGESLKGSGGSGAEGVSVVTGGDDSGTPADWEAGSGSDAGAGGNTTPFLGTWPGNFSTGVNCPTSLPTTGSGADTLVITAGPAGASAGVISVLSADGCIFGYTVDGYTATALPNQMCRETKDGSVTEDLAVVSRTLTLAGGELNEIGSVNITTNSVTCSQTEQGTYTQ
jgi:hypothetical protein